MNLGKRMGHDAWRSKYLYTVDSSKKCFVARKQCKRNPLFLFYGNNCRTNAPENYVIPKLATFFYISVSFFLHVKNLSFNTVIKF